MPNGSLLLRHGLREWLAAMSMLPWSPIPRRVVPALHRAGANRTCWPDAHPGPRVASSARLHAPPCFCHQRGLVARRLPAICCPPAPARSFLTIPASPVRSGQSAPHGRALGPVASSESPDHGPCSAPLLASCCMAWRRRDSRIPKESHEDSEIAEAPALPWTSSPLIYAVRTIRAALGGQPAGRWPPSAARRKVR